MKHIPFYEKLFGLPVLLISDEERFKYTTRTLVACYKYQADAILVTEEYYLLPKDVRHFIFYHELGHKMSYPDTSEEAANAWAIKHYPGNGKAALEKLDACTPAIRAATRKRLAEKGIAIPGEEVAA